ncbi:MAG: hypothetical protein OZSIB_4085 [Candidatus Ozemobacter sibiricus]|uniref:Uncharacterized protein n=1 Tax=Candidatus Ozemobacter sibiricus TaxID=2268124 RepID=A0A367ZNB8_9BACT|nr:MAG: hypothetical protein OZSIB_4085 [Candidatus Ozemobacter sibiricus]
MPSAASRTCTCPALLLGLLLGVALSAAAQTVQLHIDVGLNHFYKQRYLEAFKEFKAAVEKDPKNAEAHFNLGRVYKAQGFLKEAVLEFEIALAINPGHLQARRELQAIKAQLQSDVGARLKLEGLEEAQRQRQSDAPGSTPEQRAQELLRQGRPREAIALFEEAARADPFNVRLKKTLGWLYFQQNDLSNSQARYEEALRLAPDDPELHYALGLIDMRTRNFSSAASRFSQAIARSPDLVKAHFALGEAYEALGRYEDAAFQYRKVLTLNPQTAEATARLRDLSSRMGYNYFSRGSFYYQQGDYEKAEALLALAKQFGGLPADQARQIDEMLGAARFWIRKKQEEEKVRAERRETRQQSYITKDVRVEEVVLNPNPWLGKPVEWSGAATFEDEWQGKRRFFVNTNQNVNPDSNLDFVFGVVFPKPLPKDPRVSIYSQVTVKGKIIGMEKAFNTTTQTLSRRRQPIVEATEVIFTREQYEQPLVIRYF